MIVEVALTSDHHDLIPHPGRVWQSVHLGRIEDQDIWPAPIITARALAPLDLLLDYAEPYYRLAGADACCLFLKGARAEEELTEAAKNWTMAVERFSSVSDPKGVVLRFRDIARD